MNDDLNNALLERAQAVKAILYGLITSAFAFGYIVKMISENCGV